MESLPTWVWVTGIVGAVCGPTGAAWVGTKVALNGLGDRVESLEKRFEQRMNGVAEDVQDTRERLSRIEGRFER